LGVSSPKAISTITEASTTRVNNQPFKMFRAPFTLFVEFTNDVLRIDRVRHTSMSLEEFSEQLFNAGSFTQRGQLPTEELLQ